MTGSSLIISVARLEYDGNQTSEVMFCDVKLSILFIYLSVYLSIYLPIYLFILYHSIARKYPALLCADFMPQPLQGSSSESATGLLQTQKPHS